MVGYRINTPALNGGAAEQPTLFKVVPEATTPEEEDEAKNTKKVDVSRHRFFDDFLNPKNDEKGVPGD